MGNSHQRRSRDEVPMPHLCNRFPSNPIGVTDTIVKCTGTSKTDTVKLRRTYHALVMYHKLTEHMLNQKLTPDSIITHRL